MSGNTLAPLVSILMPVHNEERFLQPAIESILDQTYTNWELIIIDDHSTDRTREIGDSYARKNSRISILQNNGRGKVAAFNAGFSSASGQYIHLFAGDDLLEQECLEQCYKMAQAVGSTALYHDMLLVTEDLSQIGPFKLGEKFVSDSLDEMLSRGISLPSGAWFFHRTASDLAWPVPSAIPYEDMWLSICFKTQAQLYYLPEPLYKYRQHHAQTYGRWNDISQQTIRRRLRRNASVLDYLIDSSPITKYLSKQTVESLSARSRFYHLLCANAPNIRELARSDISIRWKAMVLLGWYIPALLSLGVLIRRQWARFA